jgi:hypothetical protein
MYLIASAISVFVNPSAENKLQKIKILADSKTTPAIKEIKQRFFLKGEQKFQ